MKALIQKLFSIQLIRFGLVGVLNTLIGTGIMFFAYNVLHCGYWISSALNYVVGSVFSYFANKYFTFGQKERSGREIVRFVLNIAVCYLLAYGLAEPLVRGMLESMNWELAKNIYEQIAMVVGMVLFVLLNFAGQKLLVFKHK